MSACGGHDAQYFTLEKSTMVDSYVAAAKKFKAWGFDAWELNCAGNNQTQWFFSKSRNHRDDEYGSQTFENRVRFISRVIDAVHEEVGEDFPIQVLMDAINESDQLIGENAEFNTVEGNIEIAKLLEKAGVASLHMRLGPQEQHATQFLGDLYFDTRGGIGSTSFGGQFDFTRHFQGKLVANHDGCGLMLNLSKMFKDAVSIPVGTVTYLDPAHAPDFMNQAIADGMCDFMMMNRPLTVDPQYVNKLKEGKIDEIRPCTRCCHCWNDTVKGDPYSTEGFGGSCYCCRLDPIRDNVGQEEKGMPGWFDPPAGEGSKNVMVVGAGPAGMEAARIAAERGYTVTLYDKKSSTGGMLSFAAAIKGPHQNLEDYSVWSRADLERKGVNIVTDTEVDAAFIKEQAPDVAILVLGGADSLGLRTAGCHLHRRHRERRRHYRPERHHRGRQHAGYRRGGLPHGAGQERDHRHAGERQHAGEGPVHLNKRFALRPRHEGVAGVRARERCRRCGYGEDGHGPRDPLGLRHSHRGHGHAAEHGHVGRAFRHRGLRGGRLRRSLQHRVRHPRRQLLRPGHLSSVVADATTGTPIFGATPLPAPFRMEDAPCIP
ncbi:MAG: NAD(P)-binding protein, partial [Adlercreutzia equolifaciens]